MRNGKEAIAKIRTYIPSVLIVLFSILSVFFGMFQIVKSQLSKEEILGNIAGSIIIGLTLSQLFRQQAINNARRSDEFKSSLLLYAQSKEKAEPYFDKLPSFCVYKNEQELINSKREYLSDNNLNYKKFLKGYYEVEEVRNKLDKKQLKALATVNTIKIYNITQHDLTSECSRKRRYTTSKWFKPTSVFGESEETYMKKKAAKGIVSKFFLGFIFGYFALKSILDANNLDQLMWTLFGLFVYLILGFLDYFATYNYMIEEYRSVHIIQKKDYFEEFLILVTNRSEVLEEYDDFKLIMELKEKRKQQEIERLKEEILLPEKEEIIEETQECKEEVSNILDDNSETIADNEKGEIINGECEI